MTKLEKVLIENEALWNRELSLTLDEQLHILSTMTKVDNLDGSTDEDRLPSILICAIIKLTFLRKDLEDKLSAANLLLEIKMESGHSDN